MNSQFIAQLGKLADEYANVVIKNEPEKNWKTIRDCHFAELVHYNTREMILDAILAHSIWSPQKWELESD